MRDLRNCGDFLKGFERHFFPESHTPIISPMRQESPHSFPSQPWTEHGFSMAKFLSIIQNPLPSQTPGLGMRPPGRTLQDSPHSFPLQVSATATCNIAVLNNRMAYVWKFTK